MNLRTHYVTEGRARLLCATLSILLVSLLAAEAAEPLLVRRAEPRRSLASLQGKAERTRWVSSPSDPLWRSTERGRYYGVARGHAIVSWHRYGFRAPGLHAHEQRRLRRRLLVLTCMPWGTWTLLQHLVAPLLRDAFQSQRDARAFTPSRYAYVGWRLTLWGSRRRVADGCWVWYAYHLLFPPLDPSLTRVLAFVVRVLWCEDLSRACRGWRLALVALEGTRLLHAIHTRG